jgi:Ribbon-helix-helix protein, copG family
VERITATLPDEHAALLRQEAAERGTTVAAVVRAAVEALAEPGQAASEIRQRIKTDPRGGARSGAGRPRRTWLTATDTAVAVREELHRGDEDFALRTVARFVADLRGLERPNDLARSLAKPPTTGSRRWDTLLAVAAGRECRRREVDRPSWTKPPALPSWWFPLLADPVLTARTMQRTPIELSARGIWLEASALETA